MRDSNIYGPGDDDYGRDKWREENFKKNLDKIFKPWTGFVKSNKNMVRAKFNVAGITKYGNAGGGRVVLLPVIGNSEENKAFWKATPNGKIELYIDNPDAFKAIDFGQYYVDFTPAEV